jgi:hypothetical protein
MCSKLDFLPPRIFSDFSLLSIYFFAWNIEFEFIFGLENSWQVGPVCHWLNRHAPRPDWLPGVALSSRTHHKKCRPSRPLCPSRQPGPDAARPYLRHLLRPGKHRHRCLLWCRPPPSHDVLLLQADLATTPRDVVLEPAVHRRWVRAALPSSSPASVATHPFLFSL